MKKKMLVLFLAVGMILGGCQNTQEKPQTGKREETSRDETEDTPEEEKNYDVKLSKNLYDFEFAINDTVFHLPQALDDWKETGWSYERAESEEMLDGDSFLEGETLKNEEKELIVDIVNLDGEKQQLGACSVGGVTLENTDKDNMVYQLPGKITVGESTLDDVLDAYGDPDDRYEEKDWVYVTYEYGIYKKADLVFDIEDEVLEKAVLKNYRDSEPEETSKDVPKEVSDYQAPEAFSENPLDFIVQFDGDFYQLPAPVSEFIKNGWKIDEEGSDTSVKAGRHGYVTLEKDGQTLYGVVNNYSKSAVPIKNSFLTNLHGDFDVTKVPIQIYRGITLGMNEESMKEALSDAKYETKEDEEGVSYYLYADEEKRDYVRIFVDKNLKLVREIELSNSPEGLEEKMLSEEDEKSVEASAMSGSDTLPEQE